MQLTILQILMILFSLFALSRAVLRRKDKAISILEFLFWIVVWLGVIFTAVFPQVMMGIAHSMGLISGTGMVVYVSIIALLYLVFKLYVKPESGLCHASLILKRKELVSNTSISIDYRVNCNRNFK
mgnify:CR=1 FL=1